MYLPENQVKFINNTLILSINTYDLVIWGDEIVRDKLIIDFNTYKVYVNAKIKQYSEYVYQEFMFNKTAEDLLRYLGYRECDMEFYADCIKSPYYEDKLYNVKISKNIIYAELNRIQSVRVKLTADSLNHIYMFLKQFVVLDEKSDIVVTREESLRVGEFANMLEIPEPTEPFWFITKGFIIEPNKRSNKKIIIRYDYALYVYVVFINNDKWFIHSARSLMKLLDNNKIDY